MISDQDIKGDIYMIGHTDFTEKYFRFCDEVKREEDHQNILIIANHRFKQEIALDEYLSKHFKIKPNSKGNFFNVLFDHQILFTPDVERYELVNCGYENDVEKALKPYLNNERERIRQEYLRNLVR